MIMGIIIHPHKLKSASCDNFIFWERGNFVKILKSISLVLAAFFCSSKCIWVKNRFAAYDVLLRIKGVHKCKRTL
jgi:hypothetical protein